MPFPFQSNKNPFRNSYRSPSSNVHKKNIRRHNSMNYPVQNRPGENCPGPDYRNPRPSYYNPFSIGWRWGWGQRKQNVQNNNAKYDSNKRPVQSKKPNNEFNGTKAVVNRGATSAVTPPAVTPQLVTNTSAKTNTTISSDDETQTNTVVNNSDAAKNMTNKTKNNISIDAQKTLKDAVVAETKQKNTDTNKSTPNNKKTLMESQKSNVAIAKENAETQTQPRTIVPKVSTATSSEKKTEAQIRILETNNIEQSNIETKQPFSKSKTLIVELANKSLTTEIPNGGSKVDGIVPERISAENQVPSKRIPPTTSTERKNHNHNQKVPALGQASNDPMVPDPNMRCVEQKHTSTTTPKANDSLSQPDLISEGDTVCQASNVQQNAEIKWQNGKIGKNSNKKTSNGKNGMEPMALQSGILTQLVPSPLLSTDISTKVQSPLKQQKKKKISSSREDPKIYLDDNKMSKKRTRDDRDTSRCINTTNDKQSPRDTSRCINITNDKQSPLQKKKKISRRTSKVNFVDDNTTKKRTRDDRDTNAAVQNDGFWSAEEHSRFMFLFFMYGSDFAKIATCMPTRNSTQIQNYAFSAFNGECIRHWSVDDYSVLIEKVSKQWIQIDGWNKEEVIEKIRNKPDLEAGMTVAGRKPNLNAKQSFVYERSQTHESDTESEQDFPITDFDKSTETVTNKKSNQEDKESQSFPNLVHASREIFQETRVESDDLRPSRRKSIEMNHNDVILLKRKSRFQSQNHPGNIKFQELCSSRKEQYFQENGKKNSIVRTIVDSIASMNPPGRFLQYDRDSDIWIHASDDEAVQMTHATFKNMEIVADAKNDVQEARIMKTKKYLLELASHNKPATTDDGDKAIFAAATSGRRPKRQRQSVTFFEPNATDRKSDNDGDGDSDNIETRKKTTASRKRRRELADTATADLPSRRSSKSRSLRIQRDRWNKDERSSRERKRNRVSQKATRRLISNALAGFLQRQGTAER